MCVVLGAASDAIDTVHETRKNPVVRRPKTGGSSKTIKTPETIGREIVSGVYLCAMFTEQQEKWLKRVEDLFLRYGMRSLTMDDVARELAISKKTLYQFVDNKEDLVMKVMERHINEDCQKAGALHEASTDAIDELLRVAEYNSVDFGKMKSNVIYELQRFFPNAWEKMQEYNWGFMYKVVLENLEWGIRDGLYRTDFDPDIVARMHIASVFTVFDERIFPKPPYNLELLFREYMLHYLHGIISEKGREVLKARPLK